MEKIDSIEIIDGEFNELSNSAYTIYWSQYCKKDAKNSLSISEIIDSNEEYYRDKYLSWVYELSEAKIKSERNLKEILELYPGFSFWWMTKLAEKSNYIKSPSINNAIKFFAFEDWAKKNTCKRIYLQTNNRALVDLFSKWCHENKIKLHTSKYTLPSLISWAFKFLFINEIFGILWLLQRIYIGLFFYGDGIESWKKSSGKVSFFSYLFNIPTQSIENKKFESLFWGTLPEDLNKLGLYTNWVHIYVKNKDIKNIKFKNYINALNLKNKYQKHIILDSFISFEVIFHSIYFWIRLIKIYFETRKLVPHSLCKEGYLWELFKSDFRDSLIGKSCIQNLYIYKLLEKAINTLPKAAKGILSPRKSTMGNWVDILVEEL